MQETMTVMLSHHEGGPPADAVEVPRRVGSVRLGELLGQGAAGAVFAGYDEALHRKVAVKLLHRRRGGENDPATLELLSGIRAAASIKHANIITVHAVELAAGLPVIVMEYVDGVSMRDLLRRTGPLDAELALYLLRQLAVAVEALHTAGVVHRDLKPANILFDHDGAAHVCDFGLACDFDLASFRSGATGIAGSPLYMAPEMFDGHVSPQGDVYALGVMLFEALAGRPPFAAETISEMRALHERAEIPFEQLALRGGVDEAVCEVVCRATHKTRIMRYKSAGHMLRALEPLSRRGRDEALRLRVAEIVAAISLADGAAGGADAAAGADGPARGADKAAGVGRMSGPDATVFDLVARRAAAKRQTRGGDSSAGKS